MDLKIILKTSNKNSIFNEIKCIIEYVALRRKPGNLTMGYPLIKMATKWQCVTTDKWDNCQHMFGHYTIKSLPHPLGPMSYCPRRHFAALPQHLCTCIFRIIQCNTSNHSAFFLNKRQTATPEIVICQWYYIVIYCCVFLTPINVVVLEWMTHF